MLLGHLVVLLAALFCIFSSASGAIVRFGSGPATSYEALVSSSPDLWLVASSFGVEEASLEQIEQLLQALENKYSSYEINMGLLDCTNAENKKACKSIVPPAGSPVAFSLFYEKPNVNPYTGAMFRESAMYPGVPSTNRDIDRFVSRSLQPKNLKIVEFGDVRTTIHGLNKAAALIFSEKKSTPNLYLRSIVAKHPELDFLFVPTPDKDSNIEEFKYDNLPAMFFVDPATHEMAAKFGGVLTDRPAVYNWIAEVAPHAAASSAAAGAKGKKSGSSKVSGLTPRAATFDYLQTIIAPKTIQKTDVEAVFAVVSKSAADEVEGWTKALSGSLTGAVAPVEISCDTLPSKAAEAESAATEDEEETIGQLLCKEREDSKPYIVILPYQTNLAPKAKQGAAAVSTTSHLHKALSNQPKFRSVDNDDWTKQVGKSLPESSVEMLGEDENAVNYFLQQSIGRGVLPVLVFSQKASVSPVVRNAALSSQSKAAFGFVNVANENSKILKGFGLSSLPAIVAMMPREDPNQQEGEDKRISIVPHQYLPKQMGPLTSSSLRQFAAAVYDVGHFPGRERPQNEQENASPDGVKKIYPIDVDSNTVWSEQCTNSFRGLCIVYLNNGEESDRKVGNDLLTYLGTSDEDSSKTLRDAMKLINLNAKCQNNFLSTFGIDASSLPMIIALSPFRQRYSVYRGAVDNKSVGSFVASIFRGASSTIPLSQLPSLESAESSLDFAACMSAEAGSSQPEVKSEDDDDILAEIIREEEEKKKRIAEEAREARKKAQEALEKEKEAAKAAAANKGKTKSKSKGKGKKKAKTSDEL